MRTHVELRSDAFPPYSDEEAQVNAGRFGKRLAEFLADALPRHGHKVVGLKPEDWGWRIDIENDPFPLWIGCGNYDEYPNGFLCFIEPSKPFVHRWLSRIDTIPTVERVASAVDAIFASCHAVSNVRWWSDDEART